MLKVSIIIPCFNVEDYILECLNSCYNQSYDNIEIICVDNNSKDGTYDLLSKEAKKGKILLTEERKPGACAARNKGVTIATGDWVQFLDADDLIDTKKIEHQISLYAKDKENTLIFANYNKLTTEGVQVPSDNPDKDIWVNLFITKLGITSANLWRKDILDEIGGWNESLTSSQEYELMFRWLRKSEKVVYDDASLTIVRERETGQISQSNPSKKWKGYIALRLSILDYLKTEKQIYFKSKKQYYQSYLFDLLRILAKYDLKHAEAIKKAYIDKGFVPVANNINSPSYVRLYKMLGFKNTERIKRISK